MFVSYLRQCKGRFSEAPQQIIPSNKTKYCQTSLNKENLTNHMLRSTDTVSYNNYWKIVVPNSRVTNMFF